MAGGLPRILLLGDERRGQVRRVIDRLLPWLQERAIIVDTVLRRDDPIPDVAADLCLVFGGDGTILSAARRMGRHQLPTLGINLGKLGFLAEVIRKEIEPMVEAALAGSLKEDHRLMVECSPPGHAGEPILVLNDAVVERGAFPGLIEVTVHVAGRYVTTYVGDGVIMATPVGSTAYSLAAGGPILEPGVEVFVLTPLASHALPVRPLVVSGSATIEMRLEGDPGEPVGTLVLDGQVLFPVNAGDVVRLQPSRTRFRLLQQNDDFYRILREKFGWAGSPRYRR